MTSTEILTALTASALILGFLVLLCAAAYHIGRVMQDASTGL